MINVLMAGDVVGESGRLAVSHFLPRLREKLKLDLVIVNGENADGLGLYIRSAEELLNGGADLLTLGDHIYDKSELFDYVARNPRIIRPLNFNDKVPGNDRAVVTVRGVRVMVVSLIGQLKMGIYCATSPFEAMDRLLEELDLLPGHQQPQVVLVDFHAEDMREKQSLAWYLDGKVSAVVGTHTHVPTLDARVLPNGTGKVTDLGMCGPRDGSLGMKLEPALTRFLTGMPYTYEIAGGPVQFNSVLLKIDERTGSCASIERVDCVLNLSEN